MIRLVFDMDGTIADLYNEENWLSDIRRNKTTPFDKAQPMKLNEIILLLKELKDKGKIEVVICTWTPMGASQKYASKVRKSKKEWLKKHGFWEILDEYIPLEYGTNKVFSSALVGTTILFDDNVEIRENFHYIKETFSAKRFSFPETQIVEILKLLRDVV